jgi:hypothetical protein
MIVASARFASHALLNCLFGPIKKPVDKKATTFPKLYKSEKVSGFSICKVARNESNIPIEKHEPNPIWGKGEGGRGRCYTCQRRVRETKRETPIIMEKTNARIVDALLKYIDLAWGHLRHLLLE